MFRNILVAVDGYAPSLGAAVRAIELAREGGIRVTALQVTEAVPLLHEESDAEALILKGEDAVPLVEDPLAVVKAYGLAHGVEVATVHRTGPITVEILAVADEIKPDLIVVGDSGLKGLRKLYFGSVARAVAENAHCAVMIVKKNSVDTADIAATPVDALRAPEAIAPPKLAPGVLAKKLVFAGSLLLVFAVIYFGSALLASVPFKDIAATEVLGVPAAIWGGWLVIISGVVITRIFLVRMLQEEAATRG